MLRKCCATEPLGLVSGHPQSSSFMAGPYPSFIQGEIVGEIHQAL